VTSAIITPPQTARSDHFGRTRAGHLPPSLDKNVPLLEEGDERVTLGQPRRQQREHVKRALEPAADSVVVKDGSGNVLQILGGHHVGRFTTAWMTNSGGSGSVLLTSDNMNCGPGDPFCQQGPWAYTGLAVRSVEYARVQSGAAAWFPPLRFSGQYRDVETGLHENWNRFYEGESGCAACQLMSV